jgi:hypothetical protein
MKKHSAATESFQLRAVFGSGWCYSIRIPPTKFGQTLIVEGANHEIRG